MDASWWLGIGMGVVVMGLHMLIRRGAHRLSLQASDQRTFLLLELGGLGGRMLLVFGAVALVLLSVPVHAVAFASTVVVLLILSVIMETRSMMREGARDSTGS